MVGTAISTTAVKNWTSTWIGWRSDVHNQPRHINCDLADAMESAVGRHRRFDLRGRGVRNSASLSSSWCWWVQFLVDFCVVSNDWHPSHFIVATMKVGSLNSCQVLVRCAASQPVREGDFGPFSTAVRCNWNYPFYRLLSRKYQKCPKMSKK